MSSLTLSIMEEFLRSGEPQSRKNALTALSVINTNNSIELIAKTALADPDAEVRKAAEKELTLLGERLHESAVKGLTDALVGTDLQQQQRAYAILGRLRSAGISIPSTRMLRGRRLPLAASLYSYNYPTRNLAFRLRSWKPGLLGTLVGSIFFSLYILNSSIKLRGWQWLFFAAGIFLILLVGTFQAVIATQFTTPINLQLSRLSGLLVEISRTFLSVLSGFFLLMILLLLLQMEFLRTNSLLSFLPFFILPPLAVRVGTIIGFGRFKFLTFLKRETRNWLAEITFGIIMGTLVITILDLIYLGNNVYGPTTYYNPEYGYTYYRYNLEVYILLGLTSLAATIGSACAFAKIDNEVPPR